MNHEYSDRAVLDASAVLAYVQNESGHEIVRRAVVAGSTISTVNLAEVYAKVALSGADIQTLAVQLFALGLRAEPFEDQDARATGTLYPRTRNQRLSLGDRACLALADRMGLPALTSDHAWTRENLGIDVRLIR